MGHLYHGYVSHSQMESYPPRLRQSQVTNFCRCEIRPVKCWEDDVQGFYMASKLAWVKLDAIRTRKWMGPKYKDKKKNWSIKLPHLDHIPFKSH